MAALEKIRKRAVILTVVIGLGLLAFILEEAVSASKSFFNDHTAAKVGSDKIDVMEFQKREQELSAEEQNQNQDKKVDQAIRQQQLLDEMITETLFNQEYEKVGIDVSDSELSEALTGKNPSQMAMQFAQSLGAQSPAQAYDLIFNPVKYGYQEAQVAEIKAKWLKMQNDVLTMLKAQKLQTLVAGSIQANDLDRKQMLEEGNTTCYVDFVKKDYSTLSDAKYPVSDAEIQNEYNKEKESFRMEEETRRVHYIAVNVNPSPSDVAVATKLVDKAYANLQKGPGLDSVRNMSELKVDSVVTTIDKINDAELKKFVAGASVGNVLRKAPLGNNYYLAKVLKKESSLDSVNITFVAVQGNKKLQDSVLNMLNGGKPLTEVVKIKGVQSKEPTWQQIAQAPDSLKNKVVAGGNKYFVLQSTAQGGYICKVNDKKAPKMFYTVGEVTYESYASQKTIDNLRDKFQTYLNRNKTIGAFEKNAAKFGFQAIEELVTPSTPELGYNPQYNAGISDSRKAIKWAFDNKSGMVSPIFTDNKDVMIAIALDDVYTGDYYPINFPQVKQFLTTKVRNSKKGDDLMKQYSGKANNLAGYAKLMGTAIDTTQVIFAQSTASKIDNGETGFIGRVAAAKLNALQGPWKGNSAVYVFQVVKQDRSKRIPAKQELDMQFARTRGYAVVARPEVMSRILGQATKVKKNLIKFY
jgi:peptidyl-prolyl cis-trans isomerase D